MAVKELSRRDFLKELGLIMGTSAVAAFPWLQGISKESKQTTTNHKARLAVVGCGSRGQYLLNLLRENPQADVVYLCDDYPPNLSASMSIIPSARTCSDYRKVLEDKDVDGVVIATPLHTHHRIAIDSLQAGKHLFCEKSLAMTLDDILDIYNTYKSSGNVLFVGQQRLFDGHYLAAIEMINQGIFGSIENIKTFWYRNSDWRRPVPSPELERKINWRLYREYSCGLMTEFACHQIQLGTWIWRDLPQTIYGSGGITYWKDGREVEDNVGVTYNYANGKRMTFEALGANKFYGLEEQIIGSQGTIEPEVGKYYFSQTPPMPGFLQMINNIEKDIFDSVSFAGPSWDPEIAKKNHGEYLLGKKRNGDGSRELMDAFTQAVITGEQPPMIAEEGYYASILSILGQMSIDTKSIVTFPDKYKINYL